MTPMARLLLYIAFSGVQTVVTNHSVVALLPLYGWLTPLQLPFLLIISSRFDRASTTDGVPLGTAFTTLSTLKLAGSLHSYLVPSGRVAVSALVWATSFMVASALAYITGTRVHRSALDALLTVGGLVFMVWEWQRGVQWPTALALVGSVLLECAMRLKGPRRVEITMPPAPPADGLGAPAPL